MTEITGGCALSRPPPTALSPAITIDMGGLPSAGPLWALQANQKQEPGRGQRSPGRVQREQRELLQQEQLRGRESPRLHAPSRGAVEQLAK